VALQASPMLASRSPSLLDALPISGEDAGAAGDVQELGQYGPAAGAAGLRRSRHAGRHRALPGRELPAFLLRRLAARPSRQADNRSEEHTLNSSHVKISYAVFCLKQ